MVEKEEIKLDSKVLKKLITGGLAKRGANGEWSVSVVLDGDISLADGRVLPVIRRTVTVKTRQQGRRANPAQNWGKGGGFRSKK